MEWEIGITISKILMTNKEELILYEWPRKMI